MSKADIVFLADSSNTVTVDDFRNEKSAVKRMARYFNVSPGKSRAAFISYGNSNQRVTSFNGYADLQGFDSIIDGAPRVGGTRRIDRALDAAAVELRQSTPTSQKIVVLMISGRHTPEQGAKTIDDASEQLRRQGVLTYVIAIGRDPNSHELRPIVDHPEDIFFISDFGKLPSRSIPIADEILQRTGEI